jgi:hypothetical protein
MRLLTVINARLVSAHYYRAQIVGSRSPMLLELQMKRGYRKR